MAPTCSRSSKTTRKASKPRRSHYKKKLVKPKSISSSSIEKKTSTMLEDIILPSNSCTALSSSDNNVGKVDGFDFEGVGDDMISANPCSTPKAQRFRIPQMQTCPPAPKKQRVISNCSLQRTPIAFFAPPDLEFFFFFALRDISV